MKSFPETALFVPIGNNNVRVGILKRFEAKGFTLPCFIHNDTIIHESVEIGKAVYILPGTNIMPFTKLGNFVMISMGVNIAHHVTVAKGCFFSQGANIGASINIGERAYFGIASTVMTGISEVGANVLVGAGSVVIRNISDNSVMIGNPARFLRANEQ
jgi:sugar O-acyltransferase (sialic acid O-acetyltransferase NeuD family)